MRTRIPADISADEWQLLARKLAQSVPAGTLPEWVEELLAQDLSAVQDCAGDERFFSIYLEGVSESYIDFLREQIALDARDQEWLALLERRLRCLEPLVGQRSLKLSIGEPSVLVVAWFRLPEYGLVHWEVE